MRPHNTREHVMNNHNDPDPEQEEQERLEQEQRERKRRAAKRGEPTQAPGDDESKNPVIINREQ